MLVLNQEWTNFTVFREDYENSPTNKQQRKNVSTSSMCSKYQVEIICFDQKNPGTVWARNTKFFLTEQEGARSPSRHECPRTDMNVN